MAFLGVKELTELQEEKGIISPFIDNRLKNGHYELSLGGEAYLTDSKTGKVELLNKSTNRQIDINPGQFALLLTEEVVNIPKNRIAFISIKAGEKLKGLVNVSGFHVDPGFQDHLLFSVYNAGPSTITLNSGEPYFPIWFAHMDEELSSEEAYNHNNEHYKKLNHIPTKYIETLKRGELTSPKALFDKIIDVQRALEGKISKSDEKKDRIDWLIKILIGLAVGIAVKVFDDYKAYERGYQDGKDYKVVSQQISEEIRKPFVDSVITLKIDSILTKRARK